MKKIISICLGLVLCFSFLTIPAFADFQVTYYNEEIYAGGILDLRVFVEDENLDDYSFRWQFAGVGSDSWVDLEENANYKGTKTNHLQVYTKADGDYEHWEEIPFRCLVTKGGVSKATPNIHMHILPYENMLKAMKNKAISLYEPSLTNVTDLSSTDDLNYTATAYAGSNIQILCGGATESSMTLLQNSDVQLKREIKITENGKYIVTGDKTSYIPYTVGNNAVKIEVNMRIIMAGVDRGVYQTKTINLTTKKPNITSTGKTKSACSLLRYTYNESETLASISKGTNLEIIGKEGSYYQVYYNGFVGYIGTSLVDADVNDSKIIEHVDLSIAAPLAGNVWASSVTVKPDSCFATYIEWYDKTDSHYMNSGERFVKGHDYQLVIWVSAKEGYQFKLDSNDKMLTTAIINDSLPCFTSRAYEQVIGKVIDIRYDFNNVQEGSVKPEQPVEPPAQSQHEHTPSKWRITGAYHYKACTSCGEFLEQEDHKGGEATCTDKGVCVICGEAYLETTEEHVPDVTKWIARGEMYHFHACKLCGAHCEIESHEPGPEPTETTPQTCKVCDYIIEPAKNHTHNLTKVDMIASTCTQEGRLAYYTCDGCSKLFEDKKAKKEISDSKDLGLPALAHSVSDIWECDENTHWQNCTMCKNPVEDTQEIHKMYDGKCEVCGYKENTEFVTQSYQETKTADDTTEIKTTDKMQSEEEKTQEIITPKDNRQVTVSPLVAVIIGLVCFDIAIIATVIILKKRGGKK